MTHNERIMVETQARDKLTVFINQQLLPRLWGARAALNGQPQYTAVALERIESMIDLCSLELDRMVIASIMSPVRN